MHSDLSFSVTIILFCLYLSSSCKVARNLCLLLNCNHTKHSKTVYKENPQIPSGFFLNIAVVSVAFASRDYYHTAPTRRRGPNTDIQPLKGFSSIALDVLWSKQVLIVFLLHFITHDKYVKWIPGLNHKGTLCLGLVLFFPRIIANRNG